LALKGAESTSIVTNNAPEFRRKIQTRPFSSNSGAQEEVD
jgi:hypothetical protein